MVLIEVQARKGREVNYRSCRGRGGHEERGNPRHVLSCHMRPIPRMTQDFNHAYLSRTTAAAKAGWR